MKRKPSLLRRLKWIAEFSVAKGFIAATSAIPFRLRVVAMEKIAYFLLYHIGHKLIKKLTRGIETRIANSFPEKSKEARQELLKQHFRTSGRIIAETIEVPKMDSAFIERWVVRLPDEETHYRCFNGGGIIILGHMGTLEFMATAITRQIKKELYTFARQQTNPWAHRWVTQLRNSQKMELLFSEDNPRPALKLLKQGKIVAFIADQNARKADQCYPFLNQLASTHHGPAMFARITKVPIYFVSSWHDESGRLFFKLQDVPRPSIDRSNIQEWERSFTYRWVKLLEKEVLQHPQEYLWSHQRWRTQPEDPQKVWDFWRKWEEQNRMLHSPSYARD